MYHRQSDLELAISVFGRPKVLWPLFGGGYLSCSPISDHYESFDMKFAPCKSCTYTERRKDSSVSIVTRLRAARSRLRIPVGERDFSLFQIVQTFCVVYQPPILWVPGSYFLGIKRPVLEVDLSPSSSAEVKNQ
jgi:hypothetical protein